MKNTLFLLICFLASLPASPAFSQPSARIAGGPYLQNVTENGFTVIWTTTTDAAAWVETAPDDGTHFYAVERPKYYDSHLGRRRLGKLHRVRVGGLITHRQRPSTAGGVTFLNLEDETGMLNVVCSAGVFAVANCDSSVVAAAVPASMPSSRYWPCSP